MVKEIEPKILKQMMDAAMQARGNAYCPYSEHPVGAAVLTQSDKIYGGCNVEAAHYKGICAEGSALSVMATQGERYIKAIAIIGPSAEYLCTPCGDCRQRIREFADQDTVIYALKSNGDVGAIYSLEELLPVSFGPDHIKILDRK